MIIFSINVHEKINLLIKQIENIETYVKVEYKIIINPNKLMFNKISNTDYINSKNYIYLNNYLEKKRHHGSLTKGIYLNMEYAINKFNFDYFIILSSRNLFYRNIDDKNIKNFVEILIGPQMQSISGLQYGGGGITYDQLNVKLWHWPTFKKNPII